MRLEELSFNFNRGQSFLSDGFGLDFPIARHDLVEALAPVRGRYAATPLDSAALTRWFELAALDPDEAGGVMARALSRSAAPRSPELVRRVAQGLPVETLDRLGEGLVSMQAELRVRDAFNQVKLPANPFTDRAAYQSALLDALAPRFPKAPRAWLEDTIRRSFAVSGDGPEVFVSRDFMREYLVSDLRNYLGAEASGADLKERVQARSQRVVQTPSGVSPLASGIAPRF